MSASSISSGDAEPDRDYGIISEGIEIDYDMSKSPLIKECQHFIECCQTRKQPITNGEEGLRVLEVLKGLQESLEKKQTLLVDSEEVESVMTNLPFNK